jgi:periplasmic protein TonB
MARLKKPHADLMRQYKKVFELSIIASLVLLILAFKFFPHIKPTKELVQTPQELIKLQDVQQTRQENRPPPPPKPPIPIAAPSADALQDVNIQSTELNVNANVAPPPPPKEEKGGSSEPQYFVAVEDMPEPIGGIQAIQQKIVYPEMAKRAGIEGKVYVKAFVDEHGNVTKVEILKGLGVGLDEAAEKAVKETKFKPGKQRGKPVKVQVVIPIVFKLQ